MKTFLHSEIIPEICNRNNFKHILIDENCTKIISKNKETIVYYYDFNCNPNSNAWIARDKPTAYKYLKLNNIPAVEHIYLPYSQALEMANEYFKKHSNIVIKTCNGTCGNNVYFCNNKNTLTKAILKLTEKGTSICVSPFINYDEEYRVIICNNKAEYQYAKVRPFVVGDGKSTIDHLINAKYPQFNIKTSLKTSNILPKNVKKNLLWKHNLCNGAQLENISNENLKKAIINIALKTAKALNLKVCSIDIINTEDGLKVLEVNSGLMMESLYLSSEINKEKVIQIYTKAINISFNKLYSE